MLNANPDVYVEVLDQDTSLGLSKIGAVPYAVEADHAVNATNVTGPMAQQVVPSGAVIAFNLAQCPPGWTAVAAASGRVVVGTSTTIALGVTAGTDQLTLTTQQMPVHVHAIADPGHAHPSTGAAFVVDHYPAQCTGYDVVGGYPNQAVCGDPATAPAITNITGTQPSGEGQPFDNRQASIAFLYCKKT